MVNLQNSKSLANLIKFKFFNPILLWEEYKKDFPTETSKIEESPEVRFIEGRTTAQVFAEAVEYIPRSLIPRPLQFFLARELMELLQDEGKSNVLDYGAGAGNMGMIFAHCGFNVNFAEVEGVITRFLRWRVRREHLSCEVFGHEDSIGFEIYDLVCMQNVLEHLDKPKEVIEKITRSIRQGGYLLLTFNSSGEGLDVVSQEMYKDSIEPYLLSNFTIVENTDRMLFLKNVK